MQTSTKNRPSLFLMLVLTLAVSASFGGVSSSLVFADEGKAITVAAKSALTSERGQAIVAEAMKNPTVAKAIAKFVGVEDVSLLKPEVARFALLAKLKNADVATQTQAAQLLGLEAAKTVAPSKKANPVVAHDTLSTRSEIGQALVESGDLTAAQALNLKVGQLTAARAKFNGTELHSFEDLLAIANNPNADSVSKAVVRDYTALITTSVSDAQFSISPSELESHIANWPKQNLANFDDVMHSAVVKAEANPVLTAQDDFRAALADRGLLKKYDEGCAVR